jgi:polyphosphate glucokinase
VPNLGFGIDIGGSGIKGAVVDVETGLLTTERLPAVVQNGVARTAANVDQSWIGTNIEAVMGTATGLPVTAVNDADAAGVAEVKWGAAKDVPGLVVMVTLGTGIGTALFYNGTLIPNSELGHIELDGGDYEPKASGAAREREQLSWEKWARRLQRYFSALEFLLRPTLFVVGGGVSRRSEKFLPLLVLDAQIVPAKFQNEAGIAGVAFMASEAAASGPVSPVTPVGALRPR